jgi:SAM-dependent methyltransferase
LGYALVKSLPEVRRRLDAMARHLPRGRRAKARLLDIGCGNGWYLKLVSGLGWEAAGVDFDEKAVTAARRAGLNVTLGIAENSAERAEQYDVITLAHVIEHLHRPTETLRLCWSLLKPSGVLWIETPNMNAQGHGEFGPDWRGLEPPRHLTLFTPASLEFALRESGFRHLEHQAYRRCAGRMFSASEAIRRRQDPYGRNRFPQIASRVRDAERRARREYGVREFITIRARKSTTTPLPERV